MTLTGIGITLGRPLAAGLLFVGVATVALLAVGASWADLSSVTEERDAKADLLARSVSASRRAALMPPGTREADPFVAGESVTLGAARLDTLLRDTAVEAGCTVLSIKAEVKPDETGIPGRIEGEAVIEGQNDALQAVLLRLETGSPTVMVDDLTMDAAEAEAGAPADPASPRLRLTLTVSAFWSAARP